MSICICKAPIRYPKIACHLCAVPKTTMFGVQKTKTGHPGKLYLQPNTPTWFCFASSVSRLNIRPMSLGDLVWLERYYNIYICIRKYICIYKMLQAMLRHPCQNYNRLGSSSEQRCLPRIGMQIGWVAYI